MEQIGFVGSLSMSQYGLILAARYGSSTVSLSLYNPLSFVLQPFLPLNLSFPQCSLRNPQRSIPAFVALQLPSIILLRISSKDKISM